MSKYGVVTVSLRDIDYSATYECIVEYLKLSSVCYAKRAVLMKVLEIEGVNEIRERFEKALRGAKSIEAIAGVIDVSNFSSTDKIRLKELLHF